LRSAIHVFCRIPRPLGPEGAKFNNQGRPPPLDTKHQTPDSSLAFAGSEGAWL
jgi:hypothetical protein